MQKLLYSWKEIGEEVGSSQDEALKAFECSHSEQISSFALRRGQVTRPSTLFI